MFWTIEGQRVLRGERVVTECASEEEARAYVGRLEMSLLVQMAANKEPYGDVTYADPGYQKDGKKRYPIDTAEHVRAAWDYINHPNNEAQYSPQQVAEIKGKIRSAAKKLGVEISD